MEADRGGDAQRAFYDRHYGGRRVILRAQLDQPLFADFHARLAGRLLDGSPTRSPLRVIEQACGEGLLAAALVAEAGERGTTVAYTGADISAAAVALAADAVPGASFQTGDAVTTMQEVEPASADLIIAKNLLHHLDDPVPLLMAAGRALAADGRFVAVEPTRGSVQAWVFNVLAPRRERHWFTRGPADLERAIRAAGMRTVRVEPFSFLPYELAFATRFDAPRRRLRADPRRIARIDDAVAARFPAIANYRLWFAEPWAGVNSQ